MKNKKGKGGIIVGISILAVLMLAMLGTMVYFVAKQAPAQSTVGGTTIVQSGNLNTNNPSINLFGTDAVTNGAVTLTSVNYIVTDSKGVKTAATNATYTGIAGDSVLALGDATGYLADDAKIDSVQNGVQKITFQPYAYANATVTVKDDPVNSSNTVSYSTTNTGTNNVTKAAAGGSRTLPMIFQGVTQKSTSTILMTVETSANNGTATQSIALSCNGNQISPMAGLPSCLSATNAGSKIVAFEIPAIIGASTTNCNLIVQSATSSIVSGEFKFKFYAEQNFFDSNNALQFGICDTTPNGNNALKYQDSYSAFVTLQ